MRRLLYSKRVTPVSSNWKIFFARARKCETPRTINARPSAN
jgi:hypothetical protein